nr:hypothetical protein B0A51_00104 [Rachicladosporium sp. CCFEE 5018]
MLSATTPVGVLAIRPAMLASSAHASPSIAPTCTTTIGEPLKDIGRGPEYMRKPPTPVPGVVTASVTLPPWDPHVLPLTLTTSTSTSVMRTVVGHGPALKPTSSTGTAATSTGLPAESSSPLPTTSRCTIVATSTRPWGCTITTPAHTVTTPVDCGDCALTTTTVGPALICGRKIACRGGWKTVEDREATATVGACYRGNDKPVEMMK